MEKQQWIMLGAVFLIASISFFFASIATVNVILGWVVYGSFWMAFFALAIAAWTMYAVQYGDKKPSSKSKPRR